MFTQKQQQNISYFGKILLLFLFCGLPFISIALNLSSTSFEMENPTVVVGGGVSTSTNFQLINSVGEFVIGKSTSLNFREKAGFLYFGTEEVVVPPDNGGGGGGGVQETFPYVPGKLCKIADFNCDGVVDILDLSILLYYQHKTGDIIKPYDLNDDGEVGLPDASVMFYYWDL